MRHTTEIGCPVSTVTAAASAAGSGAPFFGPPPAGSRSPWSARRPCARLVATGTLLLGRVAPADPGLQRLLAAGDEVVAPRRQAVGLHADIARHLVDGLAAQQAHDDVHLLVGRPPRLVAEVGVFTLPFALDRHESHGGSSLSGVQGLRVRWRS